MWDVPSGVQIGETLTWNVWESRAGMLTRIAEGFKGPGAALRWYESQGLPVDRLGDDVFIIREDGVRPSGPNAHKPKERELAVA